MPRGFLCCGNLVYDILVRAVDHVRFDATTWVNEISPHLGGNGANTSYALAKLGAPVRLTGALGNDTFGDSVLSQLTGVGVDVSSVSRISEPTPTTVGLVASSGSRAFLHRPGASAHALMQPAEFSRSFVGGAAFFHLANPFALPGLRVNASEWLKRARAVGLRTSMDLGWDSRGEWISVIGPCLPYVDLLFANREEAQFLTGEPDSFAAANALRAKGAGTVVVKLGAAGCAVYSPGLELRAPGFVVETIDTTGAGDCFAGGFLAGLFYGANLEGAARLGNAAGALSVTCLGATEGLLAYKDTLRWMASTPLRVE
jgi:sugar/nucleoside kinase (ribokinase family)